MAEKKTNAMRILETEGIAYTEHTYDVSDGLLDGVTVAQKCGEDPDQVFKTLVTQGDDREHYVFVIPVAAKLDLKAAAKSVGVKSVEMIHVSEINKVTGYIRGGCSPVGMKKLYPTCIEESAILWDTILVSAGRIGAQVEVNAEDLARACGAAFADLIAE